jgi:hypothetical protein
VLFQLNHYRTTFPGGYGINGRSLSEQRNANVLYHIGRNSIQYLGFVNGIGEIGLKRIKKSLGKSLPRHHNFLTRAGGRQAKHEENL